MQFEEAAARLARLPDRLAQLPDRMAQLPDRMAGGAGAAPWRMPPGPVALMPVFTDGRPRTELRLGDVPGDRPAAVLVLVVPAPAGAGRNRGGPPGGRPDVRSGVLAGGGPGALEGSAVVREGSAVVILTERATYEGLHGGEVSFPGGKVEPGDADLEATALRESAEEIGLDPAAAGVEVLGRLDPLRIPVSRFSITPIVAIATRTPVLQASATEVARILFAPLDAFLPDAPIEIVERQVRDWPLRYGGYRIDGLHVWGATARILGQLGAVVAALDVD